MPAPAFSDSPDPVPEITCIVAEPFAPKPLIADILRTKYCIPGSVLLVEDVEICNASRSKKWRAIRLMLGDGELCIQALLVAEMHRYVDGGQISIGSYIKLEAFRLEWLDSTAGPSGKGKGKEDAMASGTGTMPYIVVSRLNMVGWNNRFLEMAGSAGLLSEIQEHDIAVAGEETPVALAQTSGKDEEPLAKVIVAEPTVPDAHLLEEVADATDDDDFEAIAVLPQRTVQKRVELATQRLQSQSASQAAAMATATAVDNGYAEPEPEPVPEGSAPPLPPWLDADPTKPLKLTPLRGIPTLPYKQNWSTNVLAVVATVSELQPSHLPPYRQRQARLAHPSTPKQVHLTVFLDPAEFAPQVGSVVLLLGVKNHRFDGGSLKKYASDRDRHGGGRWWFENPTQFAWCDVEGLQRWWDLRLS
ncbi:cyclin-like F-box [Apiospora phragmitis]|uniref:Cyclin-like F-box n=1 Tax=Apiospora phragmitis TaxID=2905665 RepID=A0ABR1WVH4_9PEZI